MHVNLANNDGHKLLIWVVDCGQLSVMEILLAKGVEINLHVALKDNFYVYNLDVVCGFEYYESNLSWELQ